jgi:hypothetical protein
MWRLFLRRLTVWLLGGEVPMLAITLTEAEAFGVLRKRCRAVSRRMVNCPYEIGSTIVARVREGEGTRPYAVLTVKTIRPMTADQMTEELAKGEGFSGLPAWTINQAALYGAGLGDVSIVRIGFDVERMLTEAQNVGQDTSRAE